MGILLNDLDCAQKKDIQRMESLLVCLLGKESMCKKFLRVFLTSPVTYLTSHVFPLKQLSLLTTVIARMARVLRKGNLDVPRSYMSGKCVSNSVLYLGAWLSLPPNIKIYN
jgi:hypothetical protein